jgi:hypothetical protein
MSEEPLTDIDEELRALLAVEPSPEFAARVRERIRTERVTRGSWFAAGAWATGVAAALLAVGIALWPSAEIPPPPPIQVVAATAPPVAPPIVESRLPSPGTGVARRRRAALGLSRQVVSRPEPEVLVDARQTAGMQRLFELFLSGAQLAPADAAALHAPIAVEPLRIPDLTIVDSAGSNVPPGRLVPNEFQPAKE